MKSLIYFILIVIPLVLIFKWYKKPAVSNEDIALDFEATNFDGTTFTLKDLLGNYILLDFWGSWCGPCRRESSELVNLYNKYGNKPTEDMKRFEIVSIAIETDSVKWHKARLHDGHNWKYQVGEFDRFSSPIAKLYKIKEIPTKLLINPDGIIISVNPTIQEIERVLADIKG